LISFAYVWRIGTIAAGMADMVDTTLSPGEGSTGRGEEGGEGRKPASPTAGGALYGQEAIAASSCDDEARLTSGLRGTRAVTDRAASK
jgi:hypothetical protein